MIDVICKLADKPVNEQDGDYYKDGLLHCGNCDTPKQCNISLFGTIKTVVCICKCRKNEIESEEEKIKQQQRLNRIRRDKAIGFPDNIMEQWTFDNDDRHNEKITEAALNYVKDFRTFLDTGQGLLLYGTVGTGKTYISACIANALIEKGYPCLVTNFARLTNIIQGKFNDKQEYIDSLNDFDLLVIDDLGAERTTEYMQEMVFNIIDSRYRSGLPMIITTNMAITEMKAPINLANSRIYDRVLQRCHPIEVTGKSRRREDVKRKYNNVQRLLGLE